MTIQMTVDATGVVTTINLHGEVEFTAMQKLLIHAQNDGVPKPILTSLEQTAIDQLRRNFLKIKL